MINLLPPENKKELIQEENWKLIMILGILILVFLISLFLILFSIKIFISGEVEVQKIIFNEREIEFKNSQMQLLQEEVITVNEKLSGLDKFYKNQRELTEIFEKISKILPSEIYLTNLSLASQPKPVSFNLTGFSPNRETLLKFKENLEKEGTFSEINFPASSWMEPVNINFTATFKIK